MSATRTLVVWCPDWPVVAAGVPLAVPAAVLRANRVVACTPVARAEGVEVHQRRRDAQARCPELVVVDDDPDRSGRAFEAVPRALETLTPRLEVVRSGCCAMPTRGPSRYHGGDAALAQQAAALVAAVLAERDPAAEVGVGVADGIFAATLAARAGVGSTTLVVPPGESASFLAPLALAVLDRPDLTDVLRRLGLRTLGDLAALPTAKVVGRFGAEGLTARRLACGLDERPPATAPPPPDLQVEAELDPPAERVEAVAFVARGLADDLQRRLAKRGSACTRLLVAVETEHGERLARMWRTEGVFSPAAIAARVRWQLEGWVQAGADSASSGGGLRGRDLPRSGTHNRPSGGVSRLWLVPDEVVAAGGRQLSFSYGPIDEVEATERAGRALARVQGLVGVEAVLAPEWRGGRGPGDRATLVTVGTSDLGGPRPAVQPGSVPEPWPGSIPEPSPAIVHPEPVPVDVLDAARRPVGVDGRGELSAPPASVQGRAVVAWAGPWPCDERWWDSTQRRRRARLQVVTTGGGPYLLVLEATQWAIEATYD